MFDRVTGKLYVRLIFLSAILWTVAFCNVFYLEGIDLIK
jgi:hypothetical protein